MSSSENKFPLPEDSAPEDMVLWVSNTQRESCGEAGRSQESSIHSLTYHWSPIEKRCDQEV